MNLSRSAICSTAVLLLFGGTVRAQTGSTEAAPSTAITWREGTPLETGRDHHAVFAVRAPGGDYLYVAGGTDYKQMFADVRRIKINPDGSTGTWEAGPALPAPRGGHSVAVAENSVILTGGQFLEGLKRIPEVYTARIRPDGSLDRWVAAPPLPRPAFHHPAVYHNGWVYVTGGQGEKVAEAGVYGARVRPDGGIEPWVELAPLPRPRSHHASFVHQNMLYVVGGLDGHPAQGNALYVDIWRAEIQPDGTLGEWKRASVLPNAYATHSAFAHGDHVYVVGGVENDQRFVNTIWRAPINAEGKFGAWEQVDPGLPAARAHVHETPVMGGRVYSVGGSNMRRLDPALHVGDLPRE